MKQNDIYINLTSGQPRSGMNNRQWQQQFEQMRLLISPSPGRKLTAWTPPPGGPALFPAEYQGETQWHYYKMFINDILSHIRRGGRDSCFYIYQIADLLRYEHDALRSCWHPEETYFEVWLDPVPSPRPRRRAGTPDGGKPSRG